MSQLSLFDIVYPQYKIKKPIRLIELFAGIGSQAMALRDLHCQFEHYRVIEVDDKAILSYNAIHGTNFEATDIRHIDAAYLDVRDTDKYDYIMTYSFPCQDLSVVGDKAGMKKGSGTRSGLLWEVERLLKEMNEKPQVLIMENVANILGKKNIGDFNLWKEQLEKLGYRNYVQTLNAKDYGIPQNRNRCFMVSILGDFSYTFPKKKQLVKKVEELLETNASRSLDVKEETLKIMDKIGVKR